ncbi:aldo/keto reductase [Synechococcales cyanobacterium C]|uniref:Aldo/keto reductase n=2 Tax=Petrachloros TaxID=2918834 RepID=A0A8K2A9W5_9CYAN|nr:aldo/keto reductase [Petrachloros mirabilis ULC683]
MQYRNFGTTGWQVSATGLGTWGIGNQWGDIDDLTAAATLRSAFDHGVNLFDTAEGYGIPPGRSEERLGNALKDVRDQTYIVSKIGSWGRRDGHTIPKTSVDIIRLCVHASLYRLKTDWVDVMLCHEGDIEDPSLYLEAFELLKQQGLIRAYGISTNEFEVLKRFNARNTCQVVEVDYSLLNRQAEADILPYCQAHDIAVLARGPLAKGLLSGQYSLDSTFTDSVRASWNPGGSKRKKFKRQMAQVENLKQILPPGQEMVTTALRFVMEHPAQPLPIPGAKSAAQATVNADAGDRPLSPQAQNYLTAVRGSERHRSWPPALQPGIFR